MYRVTCYIMAMHSRKVKTVGAEKRYLAYGKGWSAKGHGGILEMMKLFEILIVFGGSMTICLSEFTELYVKNRKFSCICKL